MGLALRIVNKRRLGLVGRESSSASAFDNSEIAIRYEVDRSLSPMSHVAFSKSPAMDSPEAKRSELCATLARAIFEVAHEYATVISRVHVFSNHVTVQFADARFVDTLDVQIEKVIRELFIHYRPGVKPTPIPQESKDSQEPQNKE